MPYTGILPRAMFPLKTDKAQNLALSTHSDSGDLRFFGSPNTFTARNMGSTTGAITLGPSDNQRMFREEPSHTSRYGQVSYVKLDRSALTSGQGIMVFNSTEYSNGYDTYWAVVFTRGTNSSQIVVRTDGYEYNYNTGWTTSKGTTTTTISPSGNILHVWIDHIHGATRSVTINGLKVIIPGSNQASLSWEFGGISFVDHNGNYTVPPHGTLYASTASFGFAGQPDRTSWENADYDRTNSVYRRNASIVVPEHSRAGGIVSPTHTKVNGLVY